jgi:hypothetical protein
MQRFYNTYICLPDYDAEAGLELEQMVSVVKSTNH